MAYNIYDGGQSDALGDRRDQILEAIKAESPDLLVMPESNWFEERGHRTFLRFERELDMRGFLTLSVPGYHLTVYTRRDVPALEFHPHLPSQNASITLRIELNGLEISVVGVLFNPYDEAMRVIESSRFLHLATGTAIMAGDFNSVRLDDPGFEDGLSGIPPARRVGMRVDGGGPRVLDHLEQAGFVDLFRRLHPNDAGPTAPTAGIDKTQAGRRIDYVVASGDLAERATECRVVRTPLTDSASDHYPIVADFDL